MEPSSLELLCVGIGILIGCNVLGLFRGKGRKRRGRSGGKGYGPPKPRKRRSKRID